MQVTQIQPEKMKTQKECREMWKKLQYIGTLWNIQTSTVPQQICFFLQIDLCHINDSEMTSLTSIVIKVQKV